MIYMTPVKWYVVMMIGAGIATFLYGFGTRSMNLVIGSLFFLWAGGFVHFLSKLGRHRR